MHVHHGQRAATCCNMFQSFSSCAAWLLTNNCDWLLIFFLTIDVMNPGPSMGDTMLQAAVLWLCLTCLPGRLSHGKLL
jgi:hypothetical protein